MPDISCYNSYYEVNLKRIAENYNKAIRYTGAKIMPVVKANAYGMGLVRVARFFEQQLGVEAMACAHVSEGVTLRENGILRSDIVVMGEALPHAMASAVAHDLQTVVWTKECAVALNAEAAGQQKVAKVHIKLNTGMNRIGVQAGEELAVLLDVLASLSHLQVAGVYTHFAQAGVQQDGYTLRQFASFQQGVEQIKARGFAPYYIHCCNTCASEWFNEAVAYSTHIRVGSLVYGYSDLDDGSNPMGVSEALSFRAFITGIRTVHSGEQVGYSGFFRPGQPTRIAIVSAGFGDCFYCLLGKKQAPVLVNGIETRLLDACMDQSFVDVTDIDCKVGDTVTFFGRSEQDTCLPPQQYTPFGQIYTAYMTLATDRVKRVYITE